MIARLSGEIVEIGSDYCIINVHGVGYLLTCSSACLRGLNVGYPAELTVETRMRAESIELFGFATPDERRWFRLLTTVQGVGAKVALALLSIGDPAKLSAAILHADTATLTIADGVGPKLAKRIASELKDRLADAGLLVSGALGSSGGASSGLGSSSDMGPNADISGGSIESDTVSALVNLGYSRAAAIAAIEKVRIEHEEATDTATLLRSALSKLARL